jgi:hypothetical protein
MFYIVEQLKGLPIENPKKSLHFGYDDTYNYFILGCSTPEEKIPGYYSSKISKEWYNSSRKYNVEEFLKQIRAIIKREKFTFKCQRFNDLNEYLG